MPASSSADSRHNSTISRNRRYGAIAVQHPKYFYEDPGYGEDAIPPMITII